MIRETIVTTVSASGVPHVAPMGATPTADGWLLQPFRPSTTLDNFLATRCGVVNFTDDPRVFAGAVTKRQTEWPTVKAEIVDSVQLKHALACHEVRVERVEDENAERPKLHCAIVHRQNLAPFPGLNRAVAAVIEGAVLVSRLRMLPKEKIDEEFAYLQIAIDKTAGPHEREAWSWLTDAVRDYQARPAAS